MVGSLFRRRGLVAQVVQHGRSLRGGRHLDGLGLGIRLGNRLAVVGKAHFGAFRGRGVRVRGELALHLGVLHGCGVRCREDPEARSDALRGRDVSARVELALRLDVLRGLAVARVPAARADGQRGRGVSGVTEGRLVESRGVPAEMRTKRGPAARSHSPRAAPTPLPSGASVASARSWAAAGKTSFASPCSASPAESVKASWCRTAVARRADGNTQCGPRQCSSSSSSAPAGPSALPTPRSSTDRGGVQGGVLCIATRPSGDCTEGRSAGAGVSSRRPSCPRRLSMRSITLSTQTPSSSGKWGSAFQSAVEPSQNSLREAEAVDASDAPSCEAQPRRRSGPSSRAHPCRGRLAR